jgi:hypothetical protein
MKSLLVFSFFCYSTYLFAQTGYDIQPDRPGLGESSQVLRKGYLQIESGGNYQWDRMDGMLFEPPIYQREIAFNSTFLRLGISDFCELRFAWNIGQEFSSFNSTTPFVDNNGVGLSPLQVGFKVKVLNGGGWIPSTALLGMMGIPNWASSHLTSSSFSPSLLIPMEWDLTDRWLLTINNGFFWDGEVIEPSYFNSLGLDWMATDKIGFFVEAYSNFDKSNKLQPGLNGGIIWRVRENLQLDLSSGFGLTREMPDGFINGGMSYRLNFNKK